MLENVDYTIGVVGCRLKWHIQYDHLHCYFLWQVKARLDYCIALKAEDFYFNRTSHFLYLDWYI